jgi:hypothetical protein
MVIMLIATAMGVMGIAAAYYAYVLQPTLPRPLGSTVADGL